MTDATIIDPELLAMDQVTRALSPLSDDPSAQKRILIWAMERFGFSLPEAGINSKGEPKPDNQTQGNKREGTFNTVVNALGADSARKMLEAAAGYLILYEGKEVFTRDELIATARGAKYWKADYNNQIPVNITRMENARFLFEKAKNVYSVESNALAAMESKLGQ